MLREFFTKAGLRLLLPVALMGLMVVGCDVSVLTGESGEDGQTDVTIVKNVKVEIKVVDDKSGNSIAMVVIKVNSETVGNTDSNGIYIQEFDPDIYEIKASKDGYDPATKSVDLKVGEEPFLVTIALIPTVTSVEINPPGATVELGGTATLAGTVTYGSGITDSDVVWSSSATSVATVTAASDAVVTGVASGSATITATSNTDTSKSASAVITVVDSTSAPTPTPTPVPTTSMTLDSGDGQSGVVGTTLSSPFVVIVTNSGANPLSGVSVTFAITSGNGSLSVTSTTTGADGKASTVLTLGATPGANTVTATSTGLSGSPVTFNATGLAATASSIAMVSGDGQSGMAGNVLSSPFVVIVTNSEANPLSGVSVTFAITSGNGSLSVITRL